MSSTSKIKTKPNQICKTNLPSSENSNPIKSLSSPCTIASFVLDVPLRESNDFLLWKWKSIKEQ